MVAVAELLHPPGSLLKRLQVAGLTGYVLFFAVLAAYGRPGTGVGQGFYVSIVLVSLAAGPLTGGVAGLAAAALYVTALVLRAPATWPDIFSLRVMSHVLAYAGTGVIVGFFASRARGLFGEAVHMIEELLAHSRRDLDSGALDAHGFDRVLASWAAQGWPFGLLVGELAPTTDRASRSDRSDHEERLRAAVRQVSSQLGPDADVARTGPAQLAVLVPTTNIAAAKEAASAIERALVAEGCRATFGWANYPAEGRDGLSLFRAASERLYARRSVRGEWHPTAVSAELVDEIRYGSR